MADSGGGKRKAKGLRNENGQIREKKPFLVGNGREIRGNGLGTVLLGQLIADQ